MSPRVILALLTALVVLASPRLAEARGGRNMCTSELNDIMREIKEAITKESCPAPEEESEMKMTKPAVVEDSVVSQILRHQSDLINNLLEQGKGISQILSTLEEDSKAHKHEVHSLQTTFNEHKKSWSSSQEEISVMQSDMHILKEEIQVTKRDIESVTVQVQEIVLNAETSAENVDDTMEEQSDRLSELADVLKALQLEMADLRESLDEQAEDIKTLKMRGFRRPGPRGGGGEESEEGGDGGEAEERPVTRPGGGRRRRPGGRRRPAGINERSLGSVLPEECSPPFMGVADGCFAVYTNMRLSWENAKEHCGRMQGDLAHPSNLPDFLFYLAEAFPGGWVFWVGGERSNAQETWKWANGKLIDAPHDFWGRGEPRQADGADCMYLHSYWGYRAGADPCGEEKYFICQQPPRQQTRPFRRQGDEPAQLQA